MPARLVVLISGTGTLLQALIDATADPGYGAEIVAVGADRPGIAGLERAARAGIPTFVEPLSPGRTGLLQALITPGPTASLSLHPRCPPHHPHLLALSPGHDRSTGTAG